ncbi:hypothetical protein SAMN05216215_111310 [Saccharopolyspora shandongensis]|uniref:Uncharacterized protein n=1 Tax=Saccharopolyspora shandongensis TaxID=418495 RepID=A0A1H3U6G8_9PSEU|nr:hypothetical protein SAMN05216215_111310 [Saccharopolyspora shandongensis]
MNSALIVALTTDPNHTDPQVASRALSSLDQALVPGLADALPAEVAGPIHKAAELMALNRLHDARSLLLQARGLLMPQPKPVPQHSGR